MTRTAGKERKNGGRIDVIESGPRESEREKLKLERRDRTSEDKIDGSGSDD